MSDERHSFAERQDLITEPVEIAKREVVNRDSSIRIDVRPDPRKRQEK